MLFTDGLMEMVEGEQEEQLKFMVGHLNATHDWQEDLVRAAFLSEPVNSERDDDKCLVWISLKKGTDKE